MRLVIAVALAACHRGPSITKVSFDPTTSQNLTFGEPAERVATLRFHDTAVFRAEKIDLDFAGFGIARRIFFEQRQDGFTWFGKLGDRGAVIFVVQNNGSITGAINTGKAYFNVIQSGNQHLLIKPKQFLPEHPRRGIPIGNQPDLVIDTEPTSWVFGKKTKIGVAFLYTQAVKGKVQDIAGLVQLSLDEANLANLVSDVPIWYSVAGLEEDKTYVEHREFEEIVDQFTKMDADLEGIHKLRTKNGDLAILLVDSSNCIEEAAGASREIKASAATAFAVVDYRAAAAGYTVAHEIGHLLGSRHEIGADPQEDPYADGHGYRATDWATIMALRCSNPDACPRLLRWSNKKLGWGDEHANNQNVFTKRRGAVSKFR